MDLRNIKIRVGKHNVLEVVEALEKQGCKWIRNKPRSSELLEQAGQFI